MFKALSGITSDNAYKRIDNLLYQNSGMKLDLLPSIREQHGRWYRSLKSNLESRNAYYHAFVSNKPKKIIDSLLLEWTNLENTNLNEESKLSILQKSLNSGDNRQINGSK